jgi:hypothetical protein
MQNATKEMEFGQGEGNFDVILVNDNLEKCFGDVVKTLQGWYPSLPL